MRSAENMHLKMDINLIKRGFDIRQTDFGKGFDYLIKLLGKFL